MERNLRETTVVNNSASLEDKEGLAVDFSGSLISSQGTAAMGIVTQGRPKDLASVVAYQGDLDAYVDASGTAVSVNDPLTAGGGTADGYLTKATLGTHVVNAYAKESASSATQIQISIA